MFRIIKKMFIVLISNIVNGSNHTNCLSLSNQKCITQPSLINLHPNKYYYLFAFKLDTCAESCNTLNDSSNKVCVPNKKRFKSKRVYYDYRHK